MGRFKKGTYSEKELKQIQAIPYQAGRDTESSVRITELARKLNRNPILVKQRWYSIHDTGSKAAPVKGATKGPAIAPMKFEVIDFVSSRIDPIEQKQMEEGLEGAVKKDLKDGKGIVIKKRLTTRARAFLQGKFPKCIFRFNKHPSNEDYVVLTKKV